MKPRCTVGFSSRAMLVAAALVVCGQSARADGGRLRFRKPAGPFIVTLFTTPDPLTHGPADFSVAVERVGQPGLVEDANVQLILTPASGQGQPLVLRATHAAATSKWLQAANFRLPARGAWNVTVLVRRGNQAGQCSGAVSVGAASAPHLTWDVLPVPLLAFLLLMHVRRKRNYDRERRRRLAASLS
jgi:hypothetical protein